MKLAASLLFALLLTACGDVEPKPDGPINTSANATTVNNSSGNAATMDAGSANNATDPLCEAADSNGFFPNCDVCGDDCDTIDAPNASGNACGCSTSACPCGLRCGSYEIAPGVSVGNICVR